MRFHSVNGVFAKVHFSSLLRTIGFVYLPFPLFFYFCFGIIAGDELKMGILLGILYCEHHRDSVYFFLGLFEFSHFARPIIHTQSHKFQEVALLLQVYW